MQTFTRTFSFLIISAALLLPASAESILNLNVFVPPSSGDLESDQACSLIGGFAEMMEGLGPSEQEPWLKRIAPNVKLCNRSPDPKIVCATIENLWDRAHVTVPGLTCREP